MPFVNRPGPIRGRPGRSWVNPPPNELAPSSSASPLPEFDDPASMFFKNMLRTQITDLSRPFTDPALDDVVGLIRTRLGTLGSAGPIAFGGGNPYAADFATQARQRIAELNQEPYSAQEEERLRTKTWDSLERQRTTAKQRATEDAARRGLGESSGVIQDAYRDVDRSYDSARTQAEADLAMFLTTERQRRRSEATGVAQALAAFGEGEAARGDSRAIANATLMQNREGQILQMAGMLADLAAQRRGETRARSQDVLMMAQELANYDPRRLAQITSILTGATAGNTPNDVFGNTLAFSNAQANQQAYASQGRSAFMQGMGQILAFLANQRNQGGGG